MRWKHIALDLFDLKLDLRVLHKLGKDLQIGLTPEQQLEANAMTLEELLSKSSKTSQAKVRLCWKMAPCAKGVKCPLQ